MCIGRNSIHRVQYYPRFQGSTGGLGMYPRCKRGNYCIYRKKVRKMERTSHGMGIRQGWVPACLSCSPSDPEEGSVFQEISAGWGWEHGCLFPWALGSSRGGLSSSVKAGAWSLVSSVEHEGLPGLSLSCSSPLQHLLLIVSCSWKFLRAEAG